MERRPLLNPADSEENKGFCHPTSTPFRFGLLFVISLICFGSYFTYDEIEPAQYRTNFNGYLTDTRFQVLYSVYSIPNTILVFFGGIIGDKIGLRLAGLIFVTLCVVGASMVALGSSLIGAALTPVSGYFLTVAGRIVFGCGAESLNVIQNSMITRWFSGGKQLAFAMGLSLSMCRLGDLFALSGTTYVVEWVGGNFNYILWLGAILCAVSLLAVLLYSAIDKASEKYFPHRIVNPEDNALNFKAVLHFDSRFWLIAIVCMSYYGGIFPFVAICNNYLTNTYKIQNAHEVGILSGIVTLSSMILSPFLGKFLDIVQRRPYFVVLGSLVVIPTHLWLAFVLPYPVIPIIFMGLSFSLVPSALWPSIPLVVKPAEVATAFGVMAAIQNTGLAIVNAVAGVIGNSSYGSKGAMWFFVFMDVIGLTFAIILVIVDHAKGGTLVKSDKKEIAYTETPRDEAGINY